MIEVKSVCGTWFLPHSIALVNPARGSANRWTKLMEAIVYHNYVSTDVLNIVYHNYVSTDVLNCEEIESRLPRSMKFIAVFN